MTPIASVLRICLLGCERDYGASDLIDRGPCQKSSLAAEDCIANTADVGCHTDSQCASEASAKPRAFWISR